MHYYLLKVRLALESGGGNGNEDFLQDYLIDEIHKMGHVFFHQKQVSLLQVFHEERQMKNVLVDFWTQLDL